MEEYDRQKHGRHAVLTAALAAQGGTELPEVKVDEAEELEDGPTRSLYINHGLVEARRRRAALLIAMTALLASEKLELDLDQGRLLGYASPLLAQRAARRVMRWVRNHRHDNMPPWHILRNMQLIVVPKGTYDALGMGK